MKEWKKLFRMSWGEMTVFQLRTRCWLVETDSWTKVAGSLFSGYFPSALGSCQLYLCPPVSTMQERLFHWLAAQQIRI